MSLVVFAICLTVGAMETANPFSTVVGRALVAMAGTFAIGLVVGAMVQKMLAENQAAVGKVEPVEQAVIGVAGKEAGSRPPAAGKAPARAGAKK